MIKTWKSSATRRFAEEGKGKFSGLDAEQADKKIKLSTAFPAWARSEAFGAFTFTS
jgi:hypothetical protein